MCVPLHMRTVSRKIYTKVYKSTFEDEATGKVNQEFFLPKTNWHFSYNRNRLVQLIFEQHGFKLRGSACMPIVSYKYSTVL